MPVERSQVLRGPGNYSYSKSSAGYPNYFAASNYAPTYSGVYGYKPYGSYRYWFDFIKNYILIRNNFLKIISKIL